MHMHVSSVPFQMNLVQLNGNAFETCVLKNKKGRNRRKFVTATVQEINLEYSIWKKKRWILLSHLIIRQKNDDTN